MAPASGVRQTSAYPVTRRNSPFLEEIVLKNSRDILVNITGGSDLTLTEVGIVADRIREEINPDAEIIFGTAVSSDFQEKIRVSIVTDMIAKSSNPDDPPTNADDYLDIPTFLIRQAN